MDPAWKNLSGQKEVVVMDGSRYRAAATAGLDCFFTRRMELLADGYRSDPRVNLATLLCQRRGAGQGSGLVELIPLS